MYICESTSQQALPFFYIAKKEKGELRPRQDYRYINSWTKWNAYPLPLVLDLLLKLWKAKYFSKLDLRWGYNNVWIKAGDKWKAAFITNWGLYKPTVMLFGLCNSLSTFQMMMNEYFHDMITKEWLVIYWWHVNLWSQWGRNERAYKVCLATLARKWSIPEAREMQICQERRLFHSNGMQSVRKHLTLVLQSPVLSCLLTPEGRTEDRTEDWKPKNPKDRTKTDLGQDCSPQSVLDWNRSQTGPDQSWPVLISPNQSLPQFIGPH